MEREVVGMEQKMVDGCTRNACFFCVWLFVYTKAIQNDREENLYVKRKKQETKIPMV